MESSQQNLQDGVGSECELPSSTAVLVQDAWFTYDGEEEAPGIKGVNLTVETGTIYALLGPSGCGKTTLISALAGLRKLQKGEIKVFGHKPGRKSGIPGPWIGLMPQELCLIMELTVEEILVFFATLNCVPLARQKERTEHVKKILEIPSGRLVSQLSGGQKRRLSLAVALIHDPPLVVLDEPTVGVDPLLRKRIWKYMGLMAREYGKTVLLTTHYVEEARAADKVGLMRHGRILVEENPRTLMINFSASTIESVFMKLCLAEETKKGCSLSAFIGQQDTDTDQEDSQQDTSLESPTSSKGDLQIRKHSRQDSIDSGTFDLRSVVDSCTKRTDVVSSLPNSTRSFSDVMLVIFGLFWKNATLLRRNLMFILLAFMTPISNLLLIRMFLGHFPVDLPVVLISSDNEPMATAFVMEHLTRNKLSVTKSQDLDGAIDEIRAGNVVSVFHIPDGFALNLVRRMRLGLRTDNATIEKGRLRITMDSSNIVKDRTLFVATIYTLRSLLADFHELFGTHHERSTYPLQIEEPVIGTKDVELTYSFIVAEMPLNLFVMGMTISALVFVRDRESNMLQRLKSCGLGPFEIMASHVVLHSVLMIVQLTSLLVLANLIHIHIFGSYFVLITLLCISSYLGMMFGIIISVLSSRIYIALLLAQQMHFLTIATAGVFWPHEALDHWLRIVTRFHPMMWIVRANKLIINNGLGFSNTEVWSAMAYSLLIIVLAAITAAIVYDDNNMDIVESFKNFKKPSITWNIIKRQLLTPAINKLLRRTKKTS